MMYHFFQLNIYGTWGIFLNKVKRDVRNVGKLVLYQRL